MVEHGGTHSPEELSAGLGLNTSTKEQRRDLQYWFCCIPKAQGKIEWLTGGYTEDWVALHGRHSKLLVLTSLAEQATLVNKETWTLGAQRRGKDSAQGMWKTEWPNGPNGPNVNPKKSHKIPAFLWLCLPSPWARRWVSQQCEVNSKGSKFRVLRHRRRGVGR